MNKILFAVVLACVACVSAFAQSPATQYKTGKIIKVSKLPAPARQGGSDAPVIENAQDWEISIQVDNTVYLGEYTSHRGFDYSWAEGKEAQVRIKGKTLYVKRANGKEEGLYIRRKTKASTP